MDAPEGSVLIDDKPIREFQIAQIRQSIGFVPQETFLFSNTLRRISRSEWVKKRRREEEGKRRQ
jgi:ABC-type transport system involved in Fe-S cluster assembly fused permease/ATPase subunit